MIYQHCYQFMRSTTPVSLCKFFYKSETCETNYCQIPLSTMLISPRLEPELMRRRLPAAHLVEEQSLSRNSRMNTFELLMKIGLPAPPSLPWTCILRFCLCYLSEIMRPLNRRQLSSTPCGTSEYFLLGKHGIFSLLHWLKIMVLLWQRKC